MNAPVINGKRRYYWKPGYKGHFMWKENPEKCIELIYVPCINSMIQCSLKRGHGKDGLYCTRHAIKTA